MQIRLANDQDEEKWNRYISIHPLVSPYHHFGWKKSIETAYGHRCYYLIAEDIKNEIIGVLPTVLIRPPLVSGKLCSLPFCDLGASLANSEAIEKVLIEKALQLVTEHHLSCFEYRAGCHRPVSAMDLEQLHQAHKVRMLLDLPATSEELMTSFKSKLRSQIRKAEKNGLTVELGNSQQLLDNFFEVFSCNMKDLGSPTHSKKWFGEIIKNYGNEIIIGIIQHQDTAVGAGIVLQIGNKASIPWASTKREYNRFSPNMLLYWSLLKHSTDNGLKTFDFGRSSYGEGTYKFKEQWGARPVPLAWKTIQENDHRTSKEQASNSISKLKFRSLVETIWRQLPLAATTLLGPKLRKYISL